MRDYNISMDHIDRIIIVCDYFDTSIIVHQTDGFIITMFDYQRHLINSYSAYMGYFVIDYAKSHGSVEIIKTSDDLRYVTFSSIVYSLILNGKHCQNSRIVSVGSSHHLFVASPEHPDYGSANFSYTNNMDLCLWVTSPNELRTTFSIDSEVDYDVAQLVYPVTDGPRFIKNPTYLLDGVDSGILNNTRSYIIIIQTDSSIIKSHFLFESKSIDEIQTATGVLMYNPHIPSMNIISSFGKRENMLVINQFSDWEIDFNKINSIKLYMPYPNTSLIFHLKYGYSGKCFTFNETYIFDFKSPASLPVLNFNNGGICLINKSSDYIDNFVLSSLVSLSINGNSDVLHQAISVGSSHQYIIASPLFNSILHPNISYENNQKLGIWFSSYDCLNITIDLDCEEIFDYLCLYIPSNDYSSPMCKNIGSFTGKQLVNIVSENTTTHVNDFAAMKCFSCFFVWSTNKEISMLKVALYGEVLDTDKDNTVYLQGIAAMNSDFKPPFVEIEEADIFPESVFTYKIITASKMEHFNENMSGIEFLYIFCPLFDTSIIIHNEKGFDATFFDHNGSIIGFINDENKYRLFDYGDNFGYVMIKNNNLESVFLHVSVLIYSMVNVNNGCKSLRVVSVGSSNKIVIGVLGGKIFSNPDYYYEDNQNICIWFAHIAPQTISIEIISEENHDCLDLFLNRSIDFVISQPSNTISGGFSIRGESLTPFFNWHTDDSITGEGFIINGSSPNGSKGFVSFIQNYHYCPQSRIVIDNFSLKIENNIEKKDLSNFHIPIIIAISFSVIIIIYFVIKPRNDTDKDGKIGNESSSLLLDTFYLENIELIDNSNTLSTSYTKPDLSTINPYNNSPNLIG